MSARVERVFLEQNSGQHLLGGALSSSKEAKGTGIFRNNRRTSPGLYACAQGNSED